MAIKIRLIALWPSLRKMLILWPKPEAFYLIIILLFSFSGVIRSDNQFQVDEIENQLLDRLRKTYGDVPINAILELKSSTPDALVSLLSIDPPMFIVDNSIVGNELLDAERRVTMDLERKQPTQVRVYEHLQFGIYDLNFKGKKNIHTESFLKLLSGKDKLPTNGKGELPLKVRIYNKEDMMKAHHSLVKGETKHDLRMIMGEKNYLNFPPISHMHVDHALSSTDVYFEKNGKNSQEWEKPQVMKFTFLVDLDDVGGLYFPLAKPLNTTRSTNGVSLPNDKNETGIFVHSKPGRLIIFSCNDDTSHHLESSNHIPIGEINKEQDRKVIVSGITWPLHKSTGVRGSIHEGAEPMIQFNGVHAANSPSSIEDFGSVSHEEKFRNSDGLYCYEGPIYEVCGTYLTCPIIDGKQCDCNKNETLCSGNFLNCTNSGYPEINTDLCDGYYSMFNFDKETCAFDEPSSKFKCLAIQNTTSNSRRETQILLSFYTFFIVVFGTAMIYF